MRKLISSGSSQSQTPYNCRAVRRALVTALAMAGLGCATKHPTTVTPNQSETTWCRYTPGTLADVIQDNLSIAHDAGWSFALQPDATLATVIYTGHTRAMTRGRQTFVEMYLRTVLQMDGRGLFEHEMKVTEDGVDRWVSVQNGIWRGIEEEIQAGDTIRILTQLAGANMGDGTDDAEWWFLVNEFESDRNPWLQQVCGVRPNEPA